MPDPNWTAQYNFSQAPEANNFTAQINGSPIIQINSTGTPSARNLTIVSDNGDVVYTTSQVPSLDSSVGCTLEWTCSQSGTGDAGMELTFLDMAFGLSIYLNEVRLTVIKTTAPFQDDYYQATAANNVDTLWRITINGSRVFNLYRNGILVLGPITIPVAGRPFQRVLFWGEGGGTTIYRKVAFWLGGAMAPG